MRSIWQHHRLRALGRFHGHHTPAMHQGMRLRLLQISKPQIGITQARRQHIKLLLGLRAL